MRLFASTLLLAGLAALAPGGTFVDDDGSVHEGAIEAFVEAGITNGCDPARFCPQRPTSRAELIAFVARGLGLPNGPDAFADDDGHHLEPELNAAAAAGVTTGCAEGLACPGDSISRAQAASILVRALDIPPSEVDAFGDDDDNFHEASINALAGAGVTVGCGGDAYCPHHRLTRGEAATLIARALGLTIPEVPSRYPGDCSTGSADAPASGFTVVPGSAGPAPEGGRQWTYLVEVQHGLAVDHGCFAAAVDGILQDAHLGWGSTGARSFRRVDSGLVDFRVTLATSGTVDAYCAPLITGGIYSCWNGIRAMINLTRWRTGAATYGSATDLYRVYLVNHEVGHAIGFGHRGCPAADAPAPVMVQQTKALYGCARNPWPAGTDL